LYNSTWNEEAKIYCKADGCFITYLIDTHFTAFLEPMISYGADTKLHAWRNASVRTRRKLDKRVTLLPLYQGHCQLHYTEASLTVSQPLVS